MGHYILSFTVYTLAMTGLIFFALFIYKKVMQNSVGAKKSKLLSVEETMSISPRKTLMIVNAGGERFLIASDVDKTSLIAKLNSSDNKSNLKNVISEEKIEHFKNIENEPIGLSSVTINNIDKLYSKQNEINNTITENKNSSDHSDKTPVHLEIITDKNPQLSEIRKIQRERKGSKNVSIGVGTATNRGFSTIKEMAHKLNEI